MRMENIHQVAECFQLLSAPIRLRILFELSAQPLGVDALQDRCGTTRNNVVKHLRACETAGAVTKRRVGKGHLYEIGHAWMAVVIRDTLSLYTQNE